MHLSTNVGRCDCRAFKTEMGPVTCPTLPRCLHTKSWFKPAVVRHAVYSSPPGTGHLPRLGQKLHVMGRPRQAIVRHATSFLDRTDYVPSKGQAPMLHQFRPLSSTLHSMLHVGEAMRVTRMCLCYRLPDCRPRYKLRKQGTSSYPLALCGSPAWLETAIQRIHVAPLSRALRRCKLFHG